MENAGYSFNGGSVAGRAIWEPVSPQIAGGRRKRRNTKKRSVRRSTRRSVKRSTRRITKRNTRRNTRRNSLKRTPRRTNRRNKRRLQGRRAVYRGPMEGGMFKAVGTAMKARNFGNALKNAAKGAVKGDPRGLNDIAGKVNNFAGNVNKNFQSGKNTEEINKLGKTFKGLRDRLKAQPQSQQPQPAEQPPQQPAEQPQQPAEQQPQQPAEQQPQQPAEQQPQQPAEQQPQQPQQPAAQPQQPAAQKAKTMMRAKMDMLTDRTKAFTQNILSSEPKVSTPAGKNCDNYTFPAEGPGLMGEYKNKKNERKNEGKEFKDPDAENKFRCLSEHYHTIYGSEKGPNLSAVKRNLGGKYAKVEKVANKWGEKARIKPDRRGKLTPRKKSSGSHYTSTGVGALAETVRAVIPGLNGGTNKNRRGKKRTRRR